jgi:hypothetical protein
MDFFKPFFQIKKKKNMNLSEAVDELIRLYDKSPSGKGFSNKFSRPVKPVRAIGQVLYDTGGIELMLQAHAKFKGKRFNSARNLEMMWDGIGDWPTIWQG